MLRQRSKGQETDRFIYARSLEREKLIDKYTIKDEIDSTKNQNVSEINSYKSQQPKIRTPRIIIDEKENSKKLYLSLLKSQIFNVKNSLYENQQKKTLNNNNKLLSRKKIRMENNNEIKTKKDFITNYEPIKKNNNKNIYFSEYTNNPVKINNLANDLSQNNNSNEIDKILILNSNNLTSSNFLFSNNLKNNNPIDYKDFNDNNINSLNNNGNISTGLNPLFNLFDTEINQTNLNNLQDINNINKNSGNKKNINNINSTSLINNYDISNNSERNPRDKFNILNLPITSKKTNEILNSECFGDLEFSYETSKNSYKKLINFEIEKDIYKEINFNFKYENDMNFNYFNFLNSSNLINSNIKRIPKSPYKVLDAPLLRDDFYLHLIDWSTKDFLAVGLEKSIYIWEGKSANVINLHTYEQEMITSIKWIKEDNLLAVGLNSGKIDLWDVEENKILSNFAFHTDRVGVIAKMHNNPDIFSSGSQDKNIISYDLRDNTNYIMKYFGHTQEICGLKWSPDDRLLASGGNDNKLIIWNTKKSQYEKKFAAHTSAIKGIDWSPHRFGFLLTGGGTQDRTIKLWNTSTMKLVESIDTASQVCNIAFSRNSHEFVSTHGYSDNLILVWDSDKMEVKASLKGHKDRVIYLSVGPDGEKIVTGAGDETIRFWDVFTNPSKNDEDESSLEIKKLNLR